LILLILLVLLVTGKSHAVRSSSRNLKTLQQREAELATRVQTAEQVPNRSEESRERIKFLGPRKGWGLVSRRCSYYSAQGEHLGELQAATLFKYSDIKSTSRNDMLLATLRDSSGWHGTYLLPCTEVAAYSGTLESVDIKIVADLRDYFQLRGEYDTLRDETLGREYRHNPFFEAYQESAQAYHASVDQAIELEKRVAQLQGIRKNSVLNELRELKYEQTRLEAELRSVRTQYRKWKDEHPVDLEKLETGRMRGIRVEMEQIRKRLADLIPPGDSDRDCKMDF